MWYEYRQARNQINNETKKAKLLYFTENPDLHKHDKKKTGKLVNELNSRNHKNTRRVTEIKLGEQVITSSAEIAETFNSYFSNVGGNLAAEIPVSEFNPEFYLKPTDKRFSLQVPTIQKVHRLLETLDEKKSSR